MMTCHDQFSVDITMRWDRMRFVKSTSTSVAVMLILTSGRRQGYVSALLDRY